ncbi:Hap4 transcription factor, heteromerization domain protein [Cordyceps fumosorosea ARSEF 2679]|uniref:Hap4 transcription factor, heteromerization domain protein n=1 Tax=Cordyceps fumosorosea (strain ARSEF 2679) TaxID=1081104 RepID=A0A168DAG8_CORFA|nr:Hap4 transcription factor, heteromerization domain protein [Cordyceps fumosorosea ARSEF 2679]OAA72360.1 Hap4 transcription factor, heteromerization domain protein [Cordyceps fumosorosea ARSEF 2679]
MASTTTTSSPTAVASPVPLPTSRPSTARARSSVAAGPAPLACAPSPAHHRAPLPTQPKPIATAAAAAAAKQPKPEPVPLPRLSVSVPPAPDKMNMAAVIAPATPLDGPKISMTSKEWVIPPRPKPGRKPATDTPPTKRKAQNRAAQRAFRERRAARVGELEEQLDLFKQDYDKKEEALKEKIHSLELDVQSFRSRCMLLENMLDRERQDRIRVETEAETLRRRQSEHVFRSERVNSAPSPREQHHRHHSLQQHRQSMSGNNRLPRPESSRDFSISQIITPPDSMDSQNGAPLVDTDVTCGNCTTDGRCACAEEVLAAATSGCGKCGFGTSCQCLEELSPSNLAQPNDRKRPSSPSNNGGAAKRTRQESSSRYADQELDFTAAFAHRQSQIAASIDVDPPPSEMMMMQSSSVEGISFKESCGFCKDGTYCACADAAMATPAMTPPESQPNVPRQVQTPPPSEGDVAPPQPFIMEMTADGAVKLPPRKPKTGQLNQATKPSGGGCGAGAPGTCAQCQADPKSGLFCRLMNAKFGKEQGGCCGGKGAGGGCCKSKPAAAAATSNGGGKKEGERITLPSLPSLGLSCAEAYQTLASHRNFSEAANDINSWLPKLKATSRTTSSSSRQSSRGRNAIEVEAASIMSVLKEFDIRFGREC